MEFLPKFIESEKERGASKDILGSATVLATLKACGETYRRIPDEEEMKKGETEISKKFNLFYRFVLEMQSETIKDPSAAS
jgi:hypothetical protein